MTIWIDAQLSPSLAPWIKEILGVPAIAIRDLEADAGPRPSRIRGITRRDHGDGKSLIDPQEVWPLTTALLAIMAPDWALSPVAAKALAPGSPAAIDLARSLTSDLRLR